MAGWSIAISGGGHRASLFGLGALLYLADAGLNTEVTSIASVSGGSLTNGYVGARVNYQSVSKADFATEMKPLVRRCAVKGTVMWAWESLLLVAGIVGGIGLGIGGWWLPGPLWVHIVVPLVALVVGLFLTQARSRVADRVFRRLLFTKDGKSLTLGGMMPGVTHVLCSTEVQSKTHAYFARDFAYSYEYGLSTTTAGLQVSTAVQASACFPGGFPPRSLRAKALGFAGNVKRRLWLVDGGVYDNMGDEWAQGFRDRMDTCPPLTEVAGEAPENLLVVNASGRSGWSKAPWLMRVPVLGEAVTFMKEKDILYQVGTTNRRSNMIRQFDLERSLLQMPESPDRQRLLAEAGVGGALVHISSSPRWTATARPFDPAQLAACERVAQKLAEFSDQNWIDQAPATANGIPTTLGKVGRHAAAVVLWHAYVLTMTNLHVFYGAPLLDLPDTDHFDALLV